MQTYLSDNATRRRRIQESATVNGIDYLEVLDLDLVGSEPEFRQRRLRLYFLKPVTITDPLVPGRDQIRIEGGQRIRDIQVLDVRPDPGATGSYVEIDLDKAGDFSNYQLRLVKDRRSSEPPDGFDQILATIEFNFKVECPNEFDCVEPDEEITRRGIEPPIDYLARDYESFRQLLMDRLTTVMPDWRERSPADFGVAMVELMAYAADYQSYHQDAVATEAYLGTARRRVSVRRHARLLDYPMHDGCNARTWVALFVDAGTSADGAILPTSASFATRPPVDETIPGVDEDNPVVPAALPVLLSEREFGRVVSEGAKVFESMHATRLLSARNELEFYTFGESRTVLRTGATSAVLRLESGSDPELRAGDVLLFAEKRDPDSGRAFDADPAHRHAVRLVSDSVIGRDDLFSVDTLTITWAKTDALPFDLVLGEVEDEGAGLVPITVAYANVVLADHGQSVRGDELIPPDVPERGRYRPRVRLSDITQSQPYAHELQLNQAAAVALQQDFRSCEPSLVLFDEEERWIARGDLLSSDRFATDFVLENEEDGRATLRFGDNVSGKCPAFGTRFAVDYRIGKGRAGNIGADSLAHVYDVSGTLVDGVLGVFNPIPAVGGVEPESIDEVKQFAPKFFQEQERAVTEEDYVRVAERFPEVQKAQATLRWTGSWHTVFISIDRAGGLDVDANFQSALTRFINPFRLTGHDLKIAEPLFVGLDISLRVQVGASFLESAVKAELREVFSNVDLPDGRRGFFHPDNFTFGEAIYLSNLIALAMSVSGVKRVDPVRFDRFDVTGGSNSAVNSSQANISAGLIDVERLEIVRLDNDPNAPENGKIEFLMEGGL